MWSGFDTLILISGILTLALAGLPLASVTPKRRLACVAIGAGAIILAIITGNLDSFTYPQLVYATPALPVLAAVAFFVENSKLPKQAAAPKQAVAATQPTPSRPARQSAFADVPLGDRVRDSTALLLLLIAATRPVYVSPSYIGPVTLAQSLAAVSIILGIAALALRYAANAQVLPHSVAFGAPLWMLRLGILAPVAVLVLVVVIADLVSLTSAGAVAVGPGVAPLLAAAVLIGAPRAAELTAATAEERARVVTITRRVALGVVYAALASGVIVLLRSGIIASNAVRGPEPRSVAYPISSVLEALFWAICLVVLARAARSGMHGAGLALVLLGGATLLGVTDGGASLAAAGYGSIAAAALAAVLCTPAVAGDLLGRPSAMRADALVFGLRVAGAASVVVAAVVALATVVQLTEAVTGAVLLIISTTMAIAAFAGAALAISTKRIAPPVMKAIAAALVAVLAIWAAAVSGSGYATSLFFGSSAFFVCLTIFLPLVLTVFAVIPLERLETLRLRNSPTVIGGYTAEQAGDPLTDAATLYAISLEAPELHPQLAANPASYPDLLDWLATYGFARGTGRS